MTYDEMNRLVGEFFGKACDIIEKHDESCDECTLHGMCDESRRMYAIHEDIELIYYRYVEIETM